MLEDMDQLPFVTPIYKRDLTIENYFIGYLRHPYLSFYTGRGCKFALHVLSIAANHWRSSVPHSQRRERHCGDRLGSAGLATGEGVFFDDVHR
jgi:hypothetical protein